MERCSSLVQSVLSSLTGLWVSNSSQHNITPHDVSLLTFIDATHCTAKFSLSYLTQTFSAQKVCGCFSSTGAFYPCRGCHVHKKNISITTPAKRKTAALRTLVRKWQKSQVSKTKINSRLQLEGLHKHTTFFEDKAISFDVTTQIPVDPFHNLIIGLGSLVIGELVRGLTASGLEVLNARLGNLSLSQGWKPLPRLKPTNKPELVDVSGKAAQHIIRLLPLALRGALRRVHLRGELIGNLREREVTPTDYLSASFECVVLLAEANLVVFAQARPVTSKLESDEPSLIEIEDSLVALVECVGKTWPDLLSRRPNAHMGWAHSREDAYLFGLVSILSVDVFELRHAPIRAAARAMSNRRVEFDLLHHEATKVSLVSLSRGASLPDDTCLSDEVKECIREDKTMRKLMRPLRASGFYVDQADIELNGVPSLRLGSARSKRVCVDGKLLKPVAVALEKEGYDVYGTLCAGHPGATLKLGDDMMLTTHAHCDLPSRPPRHTRVHGDNNEFYLCVPAPGTFHLDFEVGHVQVRQLVVLPINGLDFVVLAHVVWEKTIQTVDRVSRR